jgi:hypothetical protein
MEKVLVKRGLFFFLPLNICGKQTDNMNEIGISRCLGTGNKLEGIHA